jgi:putative SOS response-associated peptidase YedK
MTFTQWGLIPSWAKDPEIGHKLINARGETLDEKPSFRNSFKRKRCLVIADGFYEWKKVPGDGAKQPYYVRMKTGKPFAFAGLWDEWNDREGGVLLTSTIITVAPNKLIKPIHSRMPAIVRREQYGAWLSMEEDRPDRLKPLLRPYPSDHMEAFPVSPRVNSPRNDDPQCVQPLEPPQQELPI